MSAVLQFSLAALTLLAGCVSPMGDGTEGGAVARQSDEVVAAPGASGDGFGDPERAINGVRGGGIERGGVDVYSMGFPPQDNTELTLGWSGQRVTNGPGVDLVVFENGFKQTGTEFFFMDLLIVEVSLDAENWVSFPHDYRAEDESVYEPVPELWQGFAGRTPTLLHDDTNPVDPFDQEVAGGDGFDLDALPDDGALGSEIRQLGFRYVRLVTAAARTNPDTEASFVRSAISNGPDIDGVYARYLE